MADCATRVPPCTLTVLLRLDVRRGDPFVQENDILDAVCVAAG